MKSLPERERFLSILRSSRVWNLSSPPRRRRSRTIPVTLPDSSSQTTPCQVFGHAAVASATAAGAHESRSFCGSCVIPFLNSMRDRSSESEAEEEAEKIVKKRRRRSEMKMLGGELIGVNVDGSRKRKRRRDRDTLIIHLQKEREKERERGRERKRNPRGRKLTSTTLTLDDR